MTSLFAERQYTLRESSGSESNVILRMHVPQVTVHGDWACDVEIIRNDGVSKVVPAIGEDGVQALVLAFCMAEARLKTLVRDRNATLTWLDDSDSDLYLHT